MMTITYPPEMLPTPDEGEEAEVRIDCPICKGERGLYDYCGEDYAAMWLTCSECGGEGTVVIGQGT